MYPSNSHSNGNNITPISYTSLDQTIPYKHSIYDITQNSKQEDPSSSPLFYLPSPYIPYEDDVVLLHNLHDLLLQQQLPTTTTTVVEGTTPEEAVTSMADSFKNDGICQQMSRKRSSKKDRHSKIDTAQGPRDRRMRLSLKVAGEFFGLQDMLGFDKASKTVEWLLNKSKMAIKELTRGLPHMKQSCSVGVNSSSSASDCEDVSGIDESAVDGNPPATRTAKAKPSKEKRNKAMRKSAFHPLAKESREKARARARERTRAKRSKLTLEAMNHGTNRLGSWNPFEKGQEEEPRSSIIFNYDQQHNPGISQEQQHQFTDFYYGKPWEAYNNINLC